LDGLQTLLGPTLPQGEVEGRQDVASEGQSRAIRGLHHHRQPTDVMNESELPCLLAAFADVVSFFFSVM
jgi:hypothetical protein